MGGKFKALEGGELISQISVVGPGVTSDSFDPDYHQTVFLLYIVVHSPDAVRVSSRQTLTAVHISPLLNVCSQTCLYNAG
jgi:hypothetical protein